MTFKVLVLLQIDFKKPNTKYRIIGPLVKTLDLELSFSSKFKNALNVFFKY